MSSTVGLQRLAAMQGFPRATLPTEAVTVSMYITPVTSSCTIWVAYIVAIAGPAITLGGLVSGGASMGAREGESLIRQATISLKPGGGATSGPGLGAPHNNVKSRLLLCGPLAFFSLPMPGPSSPQTLTVAMLPQLAQS